MKLPWGRDTYERWLNRLLEYEDLFNQKINRNIYLQGRDLYLYSPDGSPWRVTITNQGQIAVELAAVRPASGALSFTGTAPFVVGATLVPSTSTITLTGQMAILNATRFWGWDGTGFNNTKVVASPPSTQVAWAAGGDFTPTTLTSDYYKITKIIATWDTAAGDARLGLYTNTMLANGMDAAELIYDHGPITTAIGRQEYTVTSDAFIKHGDHLFVAVKSGASNNVTIRSYESGGREDLNGRAFVTTTLGDEDTAWADPSPVLWSNPSADSNVIAVGVEYVVTDLAEPSTGSLSMSGGMPTVT